MSRKFGQRPGAIPPWEHNAAAARQKALRALTVQVRAYGRSLRLMGVAAERAAAGFRSLADAFRSPA